MADHLAWLEDHPLGTVLGSGARATASPELCQRAAEVLVDALDLLFHAQPAESRSA